MISAIAILIFSTALFLFYIQTLCEQILRREFSRPYFREVLNTIDLEFPRVRRALSASTPVDYHQMRLALKCDFLTLTYLVKNGNPKRRRLSEQEKILVAYFHATLYWLAVRHAFRFPEKGSFLKLTVILHHFANLVGERVDSISAPGTAPSR